MDRYRDLTASDREWLKKFDRASSGRATKEECTELGFSEEQIAELYKDRYAKRESVNRHLAIISENSKQALMSHDPTNAVIELIFVREVCELKNLPLSYLKK